MRQLDLRKNRPEGAAKRLYRYLRKLSVERGQNPDIEVSLLTPEQSEEHGYGRCWRVMWESGPFEWAVALSLGGTMYGPDRNDYSYTKKPEVLVTDAEKYIAECYHSFDIGFYMPGGGK